jgi:hypothetical protein
MIHHSAGDTGNGLQKKVRERFPKIEQEYYNNSKELFTRLCRPIHFRDFEICIVLADTRERLKQLMGMEKLFEKRRLLLILPENCKEIFSMGHRLLPRYVSCKMDNHEELISVLNKIIDALNS